VTRKLSGVNAFFVRNRTSSINVQLITSGKIAVQSNAILSNSVGTRLQRKDEHRDNIKNS
jgi:hypothetical protein